MNLWVAIPLALAGVGVLLWVVNLAIDEIVDMRIKRYRLLGLLPPERKNADEV